MRHLSIVLTFLLFNYFAHAQNLTDGDQMYENGVNANNQYDRLNQNIDPNNNQLNLGSNQELRDINGFNNTDSGARNNGEQSQDDSNATQILGLIMGAMFASQCGPQNPMACVMAAMSFADAAASGGNAANSAAFQNQLLPGGSGGQSLTGNEGADTANSNLAQLSDMGYNVNSDGSITTPEGQILNSGDFASSAALQEKGVSASDAEGAMDLYRATLAEAQEKAKKAKASNYGNVAGGDEGRGGGVTIIDDGAESVGGSGKKGKKTKGKKEGHRLPASELAKLKKSFNGDPIGIGQANIFLIISKKYDDKDKVQSFLKKEY